MRPHLEYGDYKKGISKRRKLKHGEQKKEALLKKHKHGEQKKEKAVEIRLEKSNRIDPIEKK